MSDPLVAQSPEVARTRLWERWSQRGGAACPFGIVLRPASEVVGAHAPFESWAYRPAYMPPGLSIHVARATPLAGPALFYLGFQRGRARAGQEPIQHGLPIGCLSGVTVARPLDGDSPAARAVQAAGLVTFRDAGEYLLELRFDDGDRGHADLRPALPLTLQW